MSYTPWVRNSLQDWRPAPLPQGWFTVTAARSNRGPYTTTVWRFEIDPAIGHEVRRDLGSAVDYYSARTSIEKAYARALNAAGLAWCPVCEEYRDPFHWTDHAETFTVDCEGYLRGIEP